MRYLVLFGAGCVLATGTILRHELRHGTRRGLIFALFLGAALTGAFWGGGNLVLGTAGMSWRRWFESALFVLMAAFLTAGFACALHSFLTGPKGNLWFAAAGAVTSVVLGICLLGVGILRGLANGWGDEVTIYAGEKVVVETFGVVRSVGYKFVNDFVHGEVVFEEDG